MWTILLMEANFNAAMKVLIGYQMIKLAQDYGLIPVECFGCCPGCTAVQVSLHCCLMSDATHQSWGLWLLLQLIVKHVMTVWPMLRPLLLAND